MSSLAFMNHLNLYVMSLRPIAIFYSPLKGLSFYPANYSIWIFTHLKLCLADAIHYTSSEWKLFRFDEMEVNSFQILLGDVTFYL